MSKSVSEHRTRLRSILSRVRSAALSGLPYVWRWSTSKLWLLANWNGWKEYWYIPLLVAVAIGAGAEGQFLAAWPYYACVLIAAVLARFQEKNLKFGALFGALFLFAYVVFQAGKHTIVVAPFAVPAAGDSILPFSGTTIANVVRDGLTNVGKVARGEPSRFPCPNSPVTSDISRAIQPDDVSLQIEQLPVQANADAVAPEEEKQVELEVKGVSLKALYSAARTVLRAERSISGDVVMAPGNSFFLFAQSDRGEGPWRVGPYPANLESLQQAGCQLAEYIYATTDPNLLAKSYINTNRSLETSLLYGERVSPELKASRDARLLWGAAEMLERDYEGAAKLLQQNVNADPSDRSSHEALGMAFVGAKDYDRAFAEFDKTLCCLRLSFRCPAFLIPPSVRAHYEYDRGIAFYHKGDYDHAIESFRRAAATRRDYVAADFFLGLTFEKLSRYKDAIIAFSTTLNSGLLHTPDAALVQWQLGDSYNQSGQSEKALTAYQASLANYIAQVVLEPDNPAPYLGAGLTDLLIGSLQQKYDLPVYGNKDKGQEILRQAVAALNYYLKSKPDDENTRLLLAKAHAQRAALFQSSKDGPSAITEYTQTIDTISRIPQSNPVFAEGRNVLVVSFVERGYSEYELKQDARAVTDTQEAIDCLSSSNANDLTAREWRARALTLQAHLDVDAKRYAAAIEKLDTALALMSSFPEASRLLGIAFFNQAGDDLKNLQASKAEEDLKRAAGAFQAAGNAESDTNVQLANTEYFLAMTLGAEERYSDAAHACTDALRFRNLSPVGSRLANNITQDCAAIQAKAGRR